MADDALDLDDLHHDPDVPDKTGRVGPMAQVASAKAQVRKMKRQTAPALRKSPTAKRLGELRAQGAYTPEASRPDGGGIPSLHADRWHRTAGKRTRELKIHVPLATWKLFQHRLIDDDVTASQALIACILAFVRGEIRVDSVSGRYLVLPTPEIVGPDETPTEGQLTDAGASVVQLRPQRPANPWDHRFDEKGRKIYSRMHIKRAVEGHLGRRVRAVNVGWMLRDMWPRPKGTRYEWVEDDPELAEILAAIKKGAYEEAMRRRLDALKDRIDAEETSEIR